MTPTPARPPTQPRTVPVRRWAVGWAALAVLCVVALATALPTAMGAAGARAPGAADPAAGQASAWLAGQLTSAGTLEPFGPGVPDWGLTIDALWALQSAGGQEAAAAAAGQAVADHVAEYATGDTWATPGTVRFAGPMAKVLVAAASLGADPAAFGGYDVRAETLGLVAPPGAGPDAGRLLSLGTADTTNLFGQALAVIGLSRTAPCAPGTPGCAGAAGVPPDVVTFLLRQQCDAGFFRLYATDGRTCDQAGADADVDATAVAVDALRLVHDLYAAGSPDLTAQVADAVARGVEWLVGEQQPGGGFRGGVATPETNANSTGLAGMVLRAAGEECAAATAASFVRSLQVPAGAEGNLAGSDGAIAYSAAQLADAAAHGAGGHIGTWQRSTPQGVFALLGTTLAQVGDPAAVPTPDPVCGAPTTSAPTTSPPSTSTATTSTTATAPQTSTTAPGTTTTNPGTAKTAPRATSAATPRAAPARAATASSRPAVSPTRPRHSAGPATTSSNGAPRTDTAGEQAASSPSGGPVPGSSPPPGRDVSPVASSSAGAPGAGLLALAGSLLLGVLAGVVFVAWQARRR